MYSIILIDHDFIQREILKKMILSTYKFVKIYEADSEDKALDIIQKYDINIFLIDITLRESSGLELAVNIRNIPKYQFKQIIFLTTHMEYITQAFKQTHFYEYIIKPYNKEDVHVMFNKIITYENEDNDKEIVLQVSVLKEAFRLP